MDLKIILEAVLFSLSKPLSLKELAQILNEKEEVVLKELEALKQELEENKRGIRLLKNDNRWQMVSASEASEYLIKIKKEELEGELSQAALETLSIIAYQGPLTRGEINMIRGVDSTYTLLNLLERGLIEREPHPQRANAYLYKISEKFLRYLGLTSIEELPDYQNLSQKKILYEFQNQS
ncbi:MAG: SMC-Scp complex subunit ScpB [Candidatus Paceibacterota bacterium]